MDLGARVRRQVVPGGGPQRLHQVPAGVVGAADVADFARVDEVVERPKRLFQRSLTVPLVHLVKVDVVGAQAPKARLALALCCFSTSVLARLTREMPGDLDTAAALT